MTQGARSRVGSLGRLDRVESRVEMVEELKGVAEHEERDGRGGKRSGGEVESGRVEK